jgi:hypothetical protein
MTDERTVEMVYGMNQKDEESRKTLEMIKEVCEVRIGLITYTMK